MIMIIYILFMSQIVFQAIWEAELLTPGPSNHLFQILQLGSFVAAIGIVSVKRHTWAQAAIIVATYVFLRFGMFDYFINFFRGLDLDYVGEGEKIKEELGSLMHLFRAVSLGLAAYMMILYFKTEKS